MMSTMAMPMNHATLMTAPVFNPNVKDSRWLTLEVCREYTRNKCSRSDEECKFAHPPPHVEVQNGRVICCFDSIKGKCQRKDPPCKYLHPPQHLKEQLLQNGRNNLILKNLQMQALAAGGMPGAMVPGIIPTMAPQYMMQQTSPFSPFMNNGMGLFQDASQQVQVSSAPSQPMLTASAGVTQKVHRPDRIESMNHVPGLTPMVKRPSTQDGNKAIAMYGASAGTASAYQQAIAAMQLQQPYAMQNEYTIAGHPPSMPRF